MDEKIKKIDAACDMLRLCALALTGRGGDKVNRSTVSLYGIYHVSAYNGLAALVSEGIDKLGVERTEENAPVLDAFAQTRAMSIRKNILLDAERETILSHLEEKGIWYMPLKGAILKDMYPKLGLRQMSDNDILFDGEYREYIRDYFVSQGYTISQYEVDFHDVYHKEPIFNYEMHVELYSEVRTLLHKYYQNVKDRLIKDDDREYGYHFTDEDFYIYLVLHAYKHFTFSETIGAKHLVDVYVYLNKKPELDFAYIERELRKIKVWKFERDCRALVNEIFDDPESFDIANLSDDNRRLLEDFMLNMLNATEDGRIENGIRKKGKFGYIMSRLFPSIENMRNYRPFFAKWYLLPFGWIYRAFDILFTRLGKSIKELKAIAKTKQDKDEK
ncbi:MAG: nucleotidyltransferase family protein [Clostridia bacterium]|nr:nucleotidyltransferase family protein [Clostridia bacterium]